MRFQNSTLSLLTLIAIWILFLNLSWNNALISYFPLSLTSSIYICLCWYFPDQFNNCSVHPHLKKSNLDKDDLGNYRPISHLSFLSKLIERVVKLHLAYYLSTNNLLNSFQSAYIKHHSTETTLLSVHDRIIKAMIHQQVTCLTLLDLSAAFDTIDISIFLNLSSWFGISSTALSWIKSDLLNPFFVYQYWIL